jgi:hypothetical protein
MTLTEQLLNEILEELRAGGGGGGSAGGGGGSAASSGFNPFKAAWSVASVSVSALGKAAGAAANGVLALSQAASNGDAGLQNFASTVSGMLPKSLGIFGSALTLAAAITEKNLSTQQALGQSGANFAGNLLAMRTAAAQSYLSLDQFAGAVAKNSDIFRTMGGNVQDGVNQFARIQKTLLTPGTDTAAMLATMGISAQDAADLTASYMRSQGSMNKQGLQDSKRVAESVANYASELTLLSQITGKSRKELQEKLDAENAEAQWEAMLATMSEEKANKLRQGMQTAMAQGGQGAVDAFKAMAMGLPPMTEAGRLYIATQEAGAASLEKIHQAAMDDSISTAKAQQINREALADAIVGGAKDMDQMRTVLQAGGLTGSALANTLSAAQKLQTAMMDDGRRLSKQEIVAKLEAMDADNKKKKTDAETAQTQQRAWQDLTNKILLSVMPVLTRFMNVVFSTTKYLGDLLIPVIQKVSAYLTNLLTPLGNIGVDFVKRVIAPFFEGIFQKLDVKSMMTPMIDFFKSVGSIVGTVDWKAIGSEIGTLIQTVWTATVDFFKPLLQKAEPVFRQIGTDLGPVIKDMGEIIISIVNLIKKYVLPVITPITEGIISSMLPMWEAFKNIIKAIKQLLAGDFEGLGTTLGKVFDNLKEAFFNFLEGVKRAIAKLDPRTWELDPRKWWSGSPESGPKTPPASTAATAPPSAAQPSQPTPPSKAKSSSKPERPETQSSTAPTPSEATVASSNRPETTLTGVESLLAELKLLNRQTADVVRFIKDTAEYTRRNYDAIKELDGNQFP